MKNPVLRYLAKNHVLSGILLVAFAFFLYEIKGVLIALFISYIIMAALYPFVAFLKRNKIPNVLAVSIAYITTFVFIALIIVPLVPFFIEQVESLLKNIPGYINEVGKNFGFGNFEIRQLNSLLINEFETIGQNAFVLTSRVFGGVLSTLTVLVVGFYLLLDRERVNSSVINLFKKNHQKTARKTIIQVEEKLGGWLRGQIVLSVFIGVITWAALTALGIEYALPLAVIAGILEILPTIGPIISAVPAIIVALTISPSMAIIVALLYFGIQILENNVLVPRIMEKAVGLNPLVIIIGIIIGGKVLGVAGALLSVPFISLIILIFNSIKNSYSNK